MSGAERHSWAFQCLNGRLLPDAPLVSGPWPLPA
jgi:hypothetical protein